MLTMPPLPVSGQYKTALNAAQKVNRSEIKAMRGINYGDALKDGDMADSLNISARRYPYIATRRAREKQAVLGRSALFLTLSNDSIAGLPSS